MRLERRWKPPRGVVAALVLLGAALCSAAAPAQPERRDAQPANKVVVVPDVHGAYSELAALLEATGVVDASLDWVAGKATLVTLGDALDRGPDSRKVLDLLMRLERAAAEKGGTVHVLLGNHEIMNLTGDLRYVSASDYAAFADEESQQLRDSAYADFAAERREPAGDPDAKAAFDRLYPPGFFARERAFRADGRYGAWLLTLPAVAVVDDTAFVHGGLPEIVAQSGAAALNRRIEEDLRRYLTLRSRLADAGVLPPWDPRRDAELARAARAPSSASAAGAASAARSDNSADPEVAALLDEFLALGDAPELGAEGPLWYRGSVYCNPFLEEPVLEAALARLGASRVVVGHTPTEDRRPRELYDGRLVMLDTGMLVSYFAGRPAALVIDGARTYVQELRPEEQVPLERGRLEAYGLTEAQLVDALSQGAVRRLDERSGFREPVRVEVEHAGKTIQALFYPEGRTRAAAHELAAYGLDRLLELDLVPATVERAVEGRRGALQLVYPDAVTERQRVEQRVPLDAWCPLEPQAELMRVFDALTHNTGRTPDNVVYRRQSAVLKLVGHGAAFGTASRLRTQETALAATPALRAALAGVDESNLETAIGRWVDAKAIAALLARRDALLAGAGAKER
ncbi:MAG TPA: metallophosphoesterase [Gammaproteobacteria bacterium]|nr:metallophosphoesterase [Gammaproteobacteria bacterium]